MVVGVAAAAGLSTAVPVVGQEDITQHICEFWQSFGLFERPRVEWYPRTNLAIQPLLEQIFDVSHDGKIDGVILAGGAGGDLHKLRDAIGVNLVPVIEVGTGAGDFADVRFDPLDRETWVKTANCILDFRQRRQRIELALREDHGPEIELIAHMFVSGRSLTAHRLVSTSEAVCYPGFPSAPVTVPMAEAMARRGLLQRVFFDRMHECGTCKSRRLSVREECPKCRSANLREVSLVHHYRCAALEPEDAFRQGSALVCPKCSGQLRNYGKDYDKPGQVQLCQSCSSTTSEPEIGFICLDCDGRTDGASIGRFDIYSYTLTEAAIVMLNRRVQRTMAAHFPASLTSEIERRHESRPTIVQVTYRNRDELIGNGGTLHFEKLRTLFLECLSNGLGQLASVHIGERDDYLLLNRRDRQMADVLKQEIRAAEAILSDLLGPALQLVGTNGRTQD
ncbi:MAG: hypothetical protein M9924_16135 [Rhizobiaceae bacterium]|nr:hypothetical protein [Rhizobiaceae bacterium]